MPYALVLPLRPLNSAPLPFAVNDCAHAAFFDLIDSVDADLAVRLHGLEERKPFTLCPLYAAAPAPELAGGRAPSPRTPILSGLRLTLLDDALFAVVVHGLLSGPQGAALRLGDALFAPTNVWLTADAHPLAGGITYEALYHEADVPDTLEMHFETPTVFRSQKRDVLWPETRLVWQSWARAWAAFAPADTGLPDELQTQAWASQVTVLRHQVQTQGAPLGNGLQAGFAGTYVYALSALDTSGRRALTALANFSFYAGTGRKTAMGMGQTRHRKPL